MAKKVRVDIKATGADKASRNLGKVDKGLGRLAKSAAGAAAAFFGARMLLDGFKSMINATREQILAETQLNAVLKSTAGVAGLTAKELTKMASALQKQTRFGDEAIIKAQSLMLTFTKVGEEVFPDAIEAVLNMSEAMGQDLQQGVIQVGKALNDPILGVTALRRVGVQLSDQQVDLVKKFTETGQVAEAQKIILGELETQFGGVAKAAGETMPGALDQMGNALGDLGETLAGEEGLAPAITATANELTRLIEIANQDITEKGFFGFLASGPKESFQILQDALGLTDEFFDKIGLKSGDSAREVMDNTLKIRKALEDSMGEGQVDLQARNGEEDQLNLIQQRYSEHLDIMNMLFDDSLQFRTEMTDFQAIEDEARHKVAVDRVKQLRKEERDAYQEKIKNNLQMAILQGQSAKEAGISVIKAEIASSQAALITKIMQALPFPFNLAVAAGAGSMIGKVTDQLLAFPTGGSFVTKGRTTLPIGNGVVVGDNASGMEQVDITPLPSPNQRSSGNIVVNINAPVVDEFVVDSIIPAIRRAEKLNL